MVLRSRVPVLINGIFSLHLWHFSFANDIFSMSEQLEGGLLAGTSSFLLLLISVFLPTLSGEVKQKGKPETVTHELEGVRRHISSK